MKKITLSVFLTCLTVFISTAQTSKELLANSVKDKFAGKWTGVLNGDSVVIYLLQTTSKGELMMPVDTTVYLYGWHEIRNNGKIIESSLCNAAYNLDKGCTVIADYTNAKENIGLFIKDITRNRILDATLTPVSPDEAILTAKLLQTCYLGSKAYLPGQTMPERIKLRRVPADMQDHRPDIVSVNLMRE